MVNGVNTTVVVAGKTNKDANFNSNKEATDPKIWCLLGSAADTAGDTAAGGANTAIEAGGTAGNTAKNTTEEVAGN